MIQTLVPLLLLSAPLFTTAATVKVGNLSVSPDPVAIKVGQAVAWEDNDALGPYVITGPWGSFNTPDGIQFDSVGTYPYTVQSIAGGATWGGSVHVSTNSLPNVIITSPTNGSVFIAPATFPFAAEALDANPGDVLDVEFWVNSVKVDDVYTLPYDTTATNLATTVTNLAAGTHTLKVIVWDYSFTKATNTITVTVVNPSPIVLTGSALVGGDFRFNASGLVIGKTNVLQASADLVSALNWFPVGTNVATGSTGSFTNPVTAEQRFFRLVQLP
jgi:hypothetical protein